jgi:hypothetical protein
MLAELGVGRGRVMHIIGASVFVWLVSFLFTRMVMPPRYWKWDDIDTKMSILALVAGALAGWVMR